MDLKLTGKRALITGASRGIGRTIAARLAAEGAQVTVVARNQAQLEQLVDEMGGKKKGHCAIALDLVKDTGPATLFSSMTGAPDIVVHNLGGSLGITDPFCPVEKWRELWRFNMEVAVELNTLLIPEMKKKSFGRIIHISSVSALENIGPAPYCAIKAALTAYTRSLGRILAAEGVVVTALLPGAVFTEEGHWDQATRTDAARVAKYLKEKTPMHRFGTTEEIANLALFLCSPLASQCVGSVFQADGGLGSAFRS